MPVPAFPTAAEAQHEEGFLNSADHTRLYWQRYRPPSPRATVAVLHGGGDHSGRYPALTTALVRAGFEVALVDFRGHGQSDGRRWHVDTFDDYLADLDAFLARLCQDGYVLSSPYLRLALRPPWLKVLGARLLGRLVPWLPVATGLEVAQLTSDPELQAWTARDPLYGRTTTPRWFRESGRAQAAVLAGAARLAAPLLVLAAGADRIADPEASRALVARAGAADKRLVVYDGFRHEIFNEAARDRPIADAVAWLVARSG